MRHRPHELARAQPGEGPAEGGDLAGDVVAEDVRQRDGASRLAETRPDVEVVERAGADADEHFAGSGGRIRDIFVAQHLRSAVRAHHDRLHGSTL
jgi:hypothetical protein